MINIDIFFNKVKPLFSVECTYDFKSATRIDYQIKAKSNYRLKNSANNVEIFIPVPCDAQAPTFKVIYYILD